MEHSKFAQGNPLDAQRQRTRTLSMEEELDFSVLKTPDHKLRV